MESVRSSEGTVYVAPRNNEASEAHLMVKAPGSDCSMSEAKQMQELESALEEEQEELEIPQRFTKSGRKRAVSFPLKLMKVLSNKDFSHIITWMPSGKSFTVLKPKAFAAEILPDHFKSAKYASFTRKLHRWGFNKHYKGDETGAFYHKDFQKDRLDLAEKMTCHKAPDSSRSDVFFEAETHSPSTEAALGQEQNSLGVSFNSMAMPPSISSTTNATALLSPSLRSNPFPQPHLSIPVPKQQRLPQLFQPQNPMPSLSNLSEISSSQKSFAVAKLNAAIELEVSRRLQERIKAAAAEMSRISRGPAALTNLLPLASHAPLQRALPMGDTESAVTASLRAKLAQMQRHKEQMQYLAMTGMIPIASQGLGELPQTNIQGAKTA
ncbi:HSF-type DNA-binding protein [Nitzschia inconspicua]|uniref:HSF-type DNA-binding protein n=1 Tax=Nitzschia inconspicua TaxID=303405 RepID=A0A9K3KE70_9STRA|nr:HSF-type DNA-binding protein [Nitzschia inconspicua]